MDIAAGLRVWRTDRVVARKPGLLLDINRAADEIERLRAAIRSTASQGTYHELSIRKAVSFELAELIVSERIALEQQGNGK